ncbi:hypothetical protein HK096_011309 [Nowakowskiella sp. JEL0078]|nr:hypothetical protein HK096_011309 [Nowakowskiella sp. JEL0078]
MNNAKNEDILQRSFSPCELLLAAETLENIVAEGTLVGARRFRTTASSSSLANLRKSWTSMGSSGSLWSLGSSGNLWESEISLKDGNENTNEGDAGEKVLRLVYGTMKYLPYIDTILVKTQFLFLNHLGLVKIFIFELMKRQFDFLDCVSFHALQESRLNLRENKTDSSNNSSTKTLPEIISETSFSSIPEFEAFDLMNELVRDLYNALHSHKTKLSAAFARIRIEHKAAGKDKREQLENILPIEIRKREEVACKENLRSFSNFSKLDYS